MGWFVFVGLGGRHFLEWLRRVEGIGVSELDVTS